MKNLMVYKITAIIIAINLPSLVIASTPPAPVNKAQVMNKAYRMQIPFIENKGQVENGVKEKVGLESP